MNEYFWMFILVVIFFCCLYSLFVCCTFARHYCWSSFLLLFIAYKITDVSAYTYERTVLMEQRTQVLQAYGNELSVINSNETIKPDELNVRRM